MIIRGTLLNELRERGFIFQITDEKLDAMIEKEIVTLYCGFDPTSDSLHLGHIVPIMALAHFQRYGHKPIVLVGGGTAQIGDPSGKQSERVLLSKEEVQNNSRSLKMQLSSFLQFNGENAAILVNNADWLEGQTLIDFLRDVAKYFTVGYLTAKESIKNRLDREQGISVTEFLYGILQSYDFMHLYKTYNCSIQIGGSDQWGNITSGTDYIRRTLSKDAYGITMPLLKKSDGTKFGKSEGGAVWLDAKKTSPYQMYQYWMNTDDRDVISFLKLFTFLSLEEIAEIEKTIQDQPEKRDAQKILSYQFTSLVHGEESAKASKEASEFLFGGNNQITALALEYSLHTIPTTNIVRERLSTGLSLTEICVEMDLVKSKTEFRKLIDQGGVYINNIRVEAERNLTENDLLHQKAILLRLGKKKYSFLNMG